MLNLVQRSMSSPNRTSCACLYLGGVCGCSPRADGLRAAERRCRGHVQRGFRFRLLTRTTCCVAAHHDAFMPGYVSNAYNHTMSNLQVMNSSMTHDHAHKGSKHDMSSCHHTRRVSRTVVLSLPRRTSGEHSALQQLTNLLSWAAVLSNK